MSSIYPPITKPSKYIHPLSLVLCFPTFHTPLHLLDYQTHSSLFYTHLDSLSTLLSLCLLNYSLFIIYNSNIHFVFIIILPTNILNLNSNNLLIIKHSIIHFLNYFFIIYYILYQSFFNNLFILFPYNFLYYYYPTIHFLYTYNYHSYFYFSNYLFCNFIKIYYFHKVHLIYFLYQEFILDFNFLDILN